MTYPVTEQAGTELTCTQGDRDVPGRAVAVAVASQQKAVATGVADNRVGAMRTSAERGIVHLVSS
jgi:hypothetical protein